MASVLIRGPLLSQSGYGVHSRQVFKWLIKSGHDVKCQILPWGITPWYLNESSLDGLIGEIMKRSSQPNGVFDISFQIQLPDEWDTSIARKNIGVTAAVETTVCNPAWITACNRMDGVIVPSDFTKEVLDNTGKITKPVSVIPESFPENFEDDIKKSKFLNLKSKHNFLLFGQLTDPNPNLDRKNTINAIKWFCEKYKNRKDIGLIVKTNMGTSSTLDKRLSVNTLQKVLADVRQGSYPRVMLLHGNMDNDELFKLYNDTSLIALISATRGEGYGLPMIEAAAAGLPVMATNWSGHKTFLQDSCWLPIKYNLIQIPQGRIDGRIFVPNSMWANVDEDDFKICLDRIHKQRSSYRKKALKQREIVLRKFSQRSIEVMYDKFMEEIL
jgi:glycosyltransferase involved in cell wall biosynthesis